MARPKRSAIQREHDLLKISNQYRNGVSQAEIAKTIGVSQQQVSLDIAELEQRWLRSSLYNIDQYKAQELAKIDNLEMLYIEAFEKSLKPFESVREKLIPPTAEGEDGEEEGAIGELLFEAKPKEESPAKDPKEPLVVERVVTRESRNGDPRYLEGIRWCIERRCKLLGLDAPQNIKLQHQYNSIKVEVEYVNKGIKGKGSTDGTSPGATEDS